MTKHATLQQIFESARDNAARIFSLRHEMLPMWHILTGNGEHVLISTPWTDDLEKEVALHVIRDFMAERSARRFVFISECWMVEVHTTNPREAMQTRASEHPDRREALRITAEDRDGKTMSGHFFILRPEHGPPKLSPFHLDDDTIALGGWLVGMLT